MYVSVFVIAVVALEGKLLSCKCQPAMQPVSVAGSLSWDYMPTMPCTRTLVTFSTIFLYVCMYIWLAACIE